MDDTGRQGNGITTVTTLKYSAVHGLGTEGSCLRLFRIGICVNGGNTNWPGEPEVKKPKHVMNRLASPPRLLRSKKLNNQQRWRFSVVHEISVEAVSLAGRK